MRVLESILLAAVIAFLLVLINKRWRKRLIEHHKTVFFSLLLICLLQLIIEGYRWQLIPLYAMTLGGYLYLYIQRVTSVLIIRRSLAFLLVLLLPIAVVLPSIIPIPNFPEPTGANKVATTSIHLIDTNRKEVYGRNKGQPREFMVQFWYPTSNDANIKYARASFLPHAEKASKTISERLGLPSFFLDHATLLTSYSYENAPISTQIGKMPLLIFSHGYESVRGQSVTLMEELASHGYIVASMEHTYGASVTIFPDGRIEFIDRDTLSGEGEEYDRSARRLGLQWQKDIEFLVEKINQNDVSSQVTKGVLAKIDLGRVGLFGHSTGGGVATRTCKYVDCNAVVGLDAWFGPVPLAYVSAGSDKPSLFLMSENWSSEKNTAWIDTFIDASPASGWYSIEGTKHFDFSDISFLSPLTNTIELTGDIDGHLAQTIQRSFVLNFFNHHVKGESVIQTNDLALDFPEVIQRN